MESRGVDRKSPETPAKKCTVERTASTSGNMPMPAPKPKVTAQSAAMWTPAPAAKRQAQRVGRDVTCGGRSQSGDYSPPKREPTSHNGYCTLSFPRFLLKKWNHPGVDIPSHDMLSESRERMWKIMA